MKFANKNNFLFYLIYLFNVLFYNKVLPYFAKPIYLVYHEWVDNHFKKTILNFKKKQIFQTYMNFFYEQSNYKVGVSENNLQIDNYKNREELFNNYYFENNSEKYDSLSNKKISVLWKNNQKQI